MLLKIIEPFYFFLALGIGLMFVYIFSPERHVVYKYPNPVNAGKITYIDKAQVCYKYKQQRVDCKKNKDNIKDYPIQ